MFAVETYHSVFENGNHIVSSGNGDSDNDTATDVVYVIDDDDMIALTFIMVKLSFHNAVSDGAGGNDGDVVDLYLTRLVNHRHRKWWPLLVQMY